MGLALSLGESHLSFGPYPCVLGKSSHAISFIVINICLPRILAACLGGGSLALSGLLLQRLTRNP